VVITPQADQRGPIKMLKIWGRANSINVQKVLWCCGELGLQYDRIDAGNEFGVTKTWEYRALNPNALVPTIEDGDFQLWESNVIVRYLAQQSGHGRLYPSSFLVGWGGEPIPAEQARHSCQFEHRAAQNRHCCRSYRCLGCFPGRRRPGPALSELCHGDMPGCGHFCPQPDPPSIGDRLLQF
jgi:hypothetical protein